MPRVKPLSDLHLVLLAHAARCPERSALPLPPSLNDDERTERTIADLLGRKLLAERRVAARAPCWRQEGEDRFGLIITDAGCEAIGVELELENCGDAAGAAAATATSAAGLPETACTLATAAAAPAADLSSMPTRRAAVIALLAQPHGATLIEVCELTGWLQHSARAFLTGLRKQGMAVTRTRTDGITRYSAQQVQA